MSKQKGLFGEVDLMPKHHCASHKKRYKDYGEDWEELANLCLTLANHICQDCHKNKATNAHHLTPLTKGGENVIENLRALCFYCHAKYHPHLRGKRRKKKEAKTKGLF